MHKLTILALLAAVAACSALYPTIGFDGTEWTLTMPAAITQLPNKLDFEAPAGSKIKQDRTVSLTAWQVDAQTGDSVAATVGGLEKLTAGTQATEFLAGIRMWNAPLGSSAELTCRLVVSKEGTNPIAAAILCNGASVSLPKFTAQRVGRPEQTVRIRTASTVGPIAALDGADVKEIAHKVSGSQHSYVFEVSAIPASIAFGTEARRVVFTFALATGVAPVAPRTEVANPDATAVTVVVETAKPKLGAGLQVLPEEEGTPPVGTFGGKVYPTQWWWGCGIAALIAIGLAVGLLIIYANKRKMDKANTRPPPLPQRAAGAPAGADL
jgi:hypothetical protein